MVLIAEKSMFQLGSDPDEAKNDSFEITQSGEDTAGYHLGTSTSPLTITSWSFSSTGPVSHSITKRTGTGFDDFNAAVLGDFTFDGNKEMLFHLPVWQRCHIHLEVRE
jgi:hypothetical protein